MKIDIIAGARPNFMKIAPIINEIENKKKKGVSISFRLIHTGQHYDSNMSEDFFKQLNIPKPNINLMVGSGTQSEQTANIMIKYEKILLQEMSDACLVVGDVNSTMACSIVAKKLGLIVMHIEAGIRSFDLTMPEEINRMVTDSITDYFFTTSKFANQNLKKLGIEDKKVFFVGNTMIDTLIKQIPKFTPPKFFIDKNIEHKKYFVLTIHRPANVDKKDELQKLIRTIQFAVKKYPVLFPVHPRTSKILSLLKDVDPNLILQIPPLPYLQFNYLVKNSLCVITDSGGITEEATVMNVPCITLRSNTERPETVIQGTNELVGNDSKKIISAINKVISGKWKKGKVPELWDGNAANRVINHIIKIM
jgi:UDP-N-acetylglucosamine 2-epimerase (non-hydrolysing)